MHMRHLVLSFWPTGCQHILSATVESQCEQQGVLQTLKYEWLFSICFISAFFHVTAIFQLFQSVSRIMHEAEREREACGEGRELPLLSGQASLLGVWPWKRTPFSETSNGSRIGYHYYAAICMHPFVSFPFNNARSFPAQFLKLVIKSHADLNWRLKFHLQALMVWWMEQLQSQSKITPPQASLRPWIPRPLCLHRRETMTGGCPAGPSLLLPSLLDSQTGISSCDESQAVTAERSRACHLWLRQIYSRS